MGIKTDKLNKTFTDFIQQQSLFFVATATEQGRVNVSPKGLDSLKVTSDSEIVWLSVTGSGNETAAHVIQNGRMTLMFCAFEGPHMTQTEVEAYWRKKNLTSIDGNPTGVIKWATVVRLNTKVIVNYSNTQSFTHLPMPIALDCS